ncbi:cytochrome P450 [Pseudonocardia eucalypti]|uniref:cytochrome P450 n=1 Tax=Pseudonocardia eucalypti TaxID=648755 RepID=UPI00160BDE7D|nr:cytochrome P450 [Pseudonocardia eucalypti]
MTTTESPATLEFDHHAQHTSHNRDEVLALVREHPVFWTESYGGHWVVTSHELAKRVLRDYSVFSSRKTEDMKGGNTIPTVVGPRLIPAEADPPYHRILRKILIPKFHKRAVDALAPELETFISGVIDEAVTKDHFDVVHDIADRIPAGSMTMYLGFPEEQRVPFIRSVQAALNVMPYASDPEFAQSEAMQKGLAEFGNAVQVINDLIAARRSEPQDDLVSHLVNPDFELDDESVRWMTFTLLVGGAENPAAMIGNSLLHLAQDTALRSRLAADHSLIPQACEELLRQTSSAVSLARNVLCDVEVGGVTMHAGDRVLVWLPGANRDHRAFERPEEVDIDRSSCPHIAFGDGPHVCIGAGLFRLWFEIMLREILVKMPNYTVDLDRAERFDDASTMWGWRTMPARVS